MLKMHMFVYVYYKMNPDTSDHVDTSNMARSGTKKYEKSKYDIARMAVWIVFESELEKHKIEVTYKTVLGKNKFEVKNVELTNIKDDIKISLVECYYANLVFFAKTPENKKECSAEGTRLIDIMKIKLGMNEFKKISEEDTKLWNKINQDFRRIGLYQTKKDFHGGTLTKSELTLDLAKFYEKTLATMIENSGMYCMEPL